MSKRFATADAFRQAIETRLRAEADRRELSVNDLRVRFVMERLLARLFAADHPPWLLKGGFAMDLRYRPNARTTRDIDLSVGVVSQGALAARLIAIRDELQAAVDVDPGDYLVFRIGEIRGELPGAPRGGGRFPIETLLSGKVYARFHLDLGFGDPAMGTPELLTGDDFLAFAGVAAARALAVPKPQQFAEKIHAYTHPWTDRINTRVKDLVDIVLFIERGNLAAVDVATALRATFATRNSHPLPTILPPPPEVWSADFPAMSAQAALSTDDLTTAFGIATKYWNAHKLGA